MFYHCVSRVVDRRFVFGERERDVFRRVLRQVEEFCGVRVVTWTILSNHFHLLVEVPRIPSERLDDEEILSRCRALYSRAAMEGVRWEYEEARRSGGRALDDWRGRYLKRMWDLGEFMKTLKQKFTLWINREHRRVGTLWESRYKSAAVEGSWFALVRVAAYIDLNAVRAGLVDDPVDYPWCGYAEAAGGDSRARKGLARAMADLKPDATWRDVGPRYRKILFGIGEENQGRAGISRGEVARVWESGGELSLAQLLRCRVRYFTDGMAVGSVGFVEREFSKARHAFGARRRSGARKMRGGDWGGLHVMRALEREVIVPVRDG